MGFKCGIVGLPNVGKSTLFNALTQTAAAQAANYPFCTIEPNVGDVAVPDPRLEKLAVIAKSAELIPTRITFVDIAGLVRGADFGQLDVNHVSQFRLRMVGDADRQRAVVAYTNPLVAGGVLQVGGHIHERVSGEFIEREFCRDERTAA